MRQVSPLPAGGAGIQVPYGKTGRQPQSQLKDEATAGSDSEDPAEEEHATLSAPPPGMGKLIDRSV